MRAFKRSSRTDETQEDKSPKKLCREDIRSVSEQSKLTHAHLITVCFPFTKDF